MQADPAGLTVNVRRHIKAPRQRVFEAWTQPEQLCRWWGPGPVGCPEAHVDLRVGGEYGIANQLPDGALVWIRGTFEVVDPPSRLVYSWGMAEGEPPKERVTVEFVGRGDGTTDVVLRHERIGSEQARASHLEGWRGCLEGLAAHVIHR